MAVEMTSALHAVVWMSETSYAANHAGWPVKQGIKALIVRS